MKIDHRSASVALALALMIGCGDDGDGPVQMDDFDFPVEVEATDTDDEPVAGAAVLVDEQLVGFTGADGTFEATLTEQPLETLEVTVEAPDGYTAVTEETSIQEKLKVAESLDGEMRGIPLTLRVDYESRLVDYLVWLDLDCDETLEDEYCRDLPVVMDGELKAQTDREGRAHFTFESIPGERHDLEVLNRPRPEEQDDDVDETEEPADDTEQTDDDAEQTDDDAEQTDDDAEQTDDDAEQTDDDGEIDEAQEIAEDDEDPSPRFDDFFADIEDFPEIEPANPRFEIRAASEPTVFHVQEELTDPEAQPAPSPSPRPSPRPSPPPSQPDEPADDETEDDDGDSDIIELF